MATSTTSAKQPCPCGSGKPFRKCCGKPLSPTQRALGKRAPPPRWVPLSDGRLLAPDDAMTMAISLQRAGQLVDAAEIYNAILAAVPDHADALHLLALTKRQSGRFEEAVELILRAIAINPNAALFHSNLSEAYRNLNKTAEAKAAALRALTLDPRLPEAALNLGMALFLQQDYPGAIEAHRLALRLRPGYLDAEIGIGDALLAAGEHDAALENYRALLEQRPGHKTLLARIGLALRRAGRKEQAISHYEACITLHPQLAEFHKRLAYLHMDVGRNEIAIRGLRSYLSLAPNDAGARHILDALEGKSTERAPADYVRDLFDHYADMFESHLVQKLAYRTPQLLGAMLCDLAGDARGLAILDLGCGTGLAGESLRAISGNLVGVDISPRMIEKTLDKGIYTEAFAADLVPFLVGCAASSYDVIIAADVFVYVGDLATIFAETRRVLRPGGWFAFTVESLEGETDRDFVLDITGRYRHHPAYLRRLSLQACFNETRFDRAIIRTQGDEPVQGYLCIYGAPSH